MGTNTEKVYIRGLMVNHIMDNMKMIENWDSELMFGQMEENMKDIGIIISNMEKEILHSKINKLEKVYGKKVKELNGWMKVKKILKQNDFFMFLIYL